MYKYLTCIEHARAMMGGQILFRPLSHFQRLENDVARSDKGEGHVSAPARGWNETQGRPLDLPRRRFFSGVKAATDIFVYCLSQRRSADLAKEFEADFAVVIKDPERLFNRTTKALPSWAELPEWEGRKGDGWRIAKPVTYDASAHGVVHAFPAEIATRKDLKYRHQQEYRILFGRRHALGFENVNYRLVPEGYEELGQPAEREEQVVVQTSTLQDIAELVSVTDLSAS